jgi:hypothetical protein
MSIAFWSEKIEAGKPATVQPPEGYVLNLVQAAMVVTKDLKADTFVSLKAETVSIESDKLESVLGTLRPVNNEQMSMSKYAIILIMIIMFPLVMVVIIVDIITIVTRKLHSDKLHSDKIS